MEYRSREKVRVMLKHNPDVLRFLHKSNGFDFEKPFEVLRIANSRENFTATNITNMLVKNGINANNLKNYKAVAVFEYYSIPFDDIDKTYADWWNRENNDEREKAKRTWYCNIESIDNLDGTPTSLYLVSKKNMMQLKCVKKESVCYKINAITTSRDFSRSINCLYHSKKRNCYIILQKNEYLVPEEKLTKSIDGLARLSLYDRKTDAILNDGMGGTLSYHKRFTNQYQLDKSGYLIKCYREKLKERLSVIKGRQEKEKAEKASKNALAEALKMKQKFDDMHPAIVQLMTEKKYDVLQEILSRHNNFFAVYKKLEKHIQKLENKEYPTTEQITDTEQRIAFDYQTLNSLVVTAEGNQLYMKSKEAEIEKNI